MGVKANYGFFVKKIVLNVEIRVVQVLIRGRRDDRLKPCAKDNRYCLIYFFRDACGQQQWAQGTAMGKMKGLIHAVGKVKSEILMQL